MADKLKFNGSQYLQDNGMEILSPADDAGVYRVRNPDGDEMKFDARAFVKDQGLNPSSVDLEFNDYKNASGISPVSLADRAKLAFGNEKGKVNFLKSKFDDVRYDEDAGSVVVKNKGVWQQVDPGAFGEGNIWERGKEVLADILDMGDVGANIASSGLGAAKGAAAGAAAGPVGAVAGGIAGAAAGGAASGAFRVALGKLAGTYDDTAEGALKDIAFEALLSAGGQSVGPALKLVGKAPGVSHLAAALKEIGTKATDVNKELIVNMVGKLSGTGTVATRTAIEHTDDVVGHLNRARMGASSVDDVVSRLKTEQYYDAKYMLDNAQGALTKRYGEVAEELVQVSGKFPSVNIQTLVDDSMESLASAGILKRNAVVDPATGKLGKTSYAPMDEVTANKMISRGQPGVPMIPKLQAGVARLMSTIKAAGNLGEVSGPEAARRLMLLRKNINSIGRQVRTKDMPAEFDRVFTQVEQSLKIRIGEEFNKAGLATEYKATSDLMQRFGDVVNDMSRMADERVGAETFLTKITSRADQGIAYKEYADTLGDLYGPKGRKMLYDIQTKHAAEKFSDYLPRTGLMPQAMTAGAVLSGPLAAAGAGLATSPRSSLKAIQLGHKTLDTMRTLSPQARLELLTHPTAMRTLFKIGTDASQQEDELTRLLTEQATQ